MMVLRAEAAEKLWCERDLLDTNLPTIRILLYYDRAMILQQTLGNKLMTKATAEEFP